MRYYEYLLPNGDEPIITTSIRDLRFPRGTRIRAIIADSYGYVLNSWRIPLTKDGKPILKGRSIKSYKSRYSYFEALNLIERVMQKSLIRRYCTQICKGHCCWDWEKKCKDPACFRGERKLFCSIYICSYLETILNISHYRYYYARYFLELEWNKKIGIHPCYARLPLEFVSENFKPEKQWIDLVIKLLSRRRVRLIIRYLLQRKINVVQLKKNERKFFLIRRAAYRFYRLFKK